jgi:hypothetical protein
MRHLRKFNEDINSKFENDQDISDLRESLLEVSDRLGEPSFNTFEMGTETGYVVQYSIPIATIGEMTTDVFYEAIDALHSTKDDILQTADRFADRFQTTISQMSGKLKIRLTPTKKQEGGYKFIKKAEGRVVEISKSELRRWAMDNGLTLTTVKEDDDEGAEMTSLEITFSGKPQGLVELLSAEKNAIEQELGELHREFEIAYAYGDENTVWLTPEEEKTYIYGV